MPPLDILSPVPVLVLGALDEEEGVVLLRPDRRCAPGDRIA